MWFILAQTSAYLLGSKIPVVTLGNVLPRVLEASVPSGLGTRERTRECVATGLEVENGVDRIGRATHSDHDCVLV